MVTQKQYSNSILSLYTTFLWNSLGKTVKLLLCHLIFFLPWIVSITYRSTKDALNCGPAQTGSGLTLYIGCLSHQFRSCSINLQIRLRYWLIDPWFCTSELLLSHTIWYVRKKILLGKCLFYWMDSIVKLISGIFYQAKVMLGTYDGKKRKTFSFLFLSLFKITWTLGFHSFFSICELKAIFQSSGQNCKSKYHDNRIYILLSFTFFWRYKEKCFLAQQPQTCKILMRFERRKFASYFQRLTCIDLNENQQRMLL